MNSILCSKDSENIALITQNGTQISFAKLNADMQRLNSGLKPRSLIFIFGNNDYAVVRWYLTSLEYNHVVKLLPDNISSSEIYKLLDIYQPRYLLCNTKLFKNIPIPENFGMAKIENFKTTDSYSIEDYLILQNRNPQPILNESLAFLGSTSGSTGTPKLVRISKKNLISNAASIAKYQNLNTNERAIAHLPLSYSFGLSILNSHLYSGGSVVLSNDSLMVRKFWETLEIQKITSFSGVPYHYEMLMKLHFSRTKFHKIKTMYQAGGALSQELLKNLIAACKDKGIQFTVMYGQTEASPRISYVPPMRIAEKIGSIGIPIPGGRMWLRDEHGNEVLNIEGQGELMYEGANVCLGYASNSDDLARCDDFNGLLATGDLAHRDIEGFYYISGRLKRILKIYGNRISLDQIEGWLAGHGLSAVATGKDDNLLIYVENQSYDKTEKTELESNWQIQISKFCNVHFSAVRVLVISSIPRLSNGKVDYQCLTI